MRLPRPATAADFAVRASVSDGEVTVGVIEASGQSLLTRESRRWVPARCGEVAADVSRDLLKIAVERVRRTGEQAVRLIRGFGLRSGAICTTHNFQEQDVIVVGTTAEDMALAVNTLGDVGGSFVVVDRGEIRELLQPPLFGLESGQP